VSAAYLDVSHCVADGQLALSAYISPAMLGLRRLSRVAFQRGLLLENDRTLCAVSQRRGYNPHPYTKAKEENCETVECPGCGGVLRRWKMHVHLKKCWVVRELQLLPPNFGAEDDLETLFQDGETRRVGLQWRVVDLLYEQKMPAEEVGAIMGISVDLVKLLSLRARKGIFFNLIHAD
jgi:hypothetical protein